MEKYEDIKAAINSFRNDTVWLSLKKRWETDFNLYRMKPYNAGKGYYSYTTNAPRVLADKIIALLSRAKLIARTPDDVMTDDDRNMASNVERLLYGAVTYNNERFARIPLMPSYQSQIAWFATLRGSFAILAYVYKNSEGKTCLHLQPWDIYNVSYEPGENGLLWASYTYTVSKAQAEAMYPDVKIPDIKSVEIIDHWNTENNLVFVNGAEAKNEKHGVDFCPVFVATVGAMPSISQTNYEYTDKHAGESIYASNRDLYPIINKTVSDYLTIVRRGVKVPLGVWSQGALRNIEDDIWQVEKASTVQLDINDKVAPLFEQTMPQNSSDLLNFVMSEQERGGLSKVALGELGFRLSGFAISQLRSELVTVASPYLEAMERATEQALLSLLKQFAGGTWSPAEVRGRTSRNEPFGIPKLIQIKPSDVSGDWHPEVRFEMALPQDDPQRYLLAQQSTQGERPLLSVQTAQDALLGIPDVVKENMLINQQFADNLPLVKLSKAYVAAVTSGDMLTAQAVVAEMARLLASQGQVGEQGSPAIPIDAMARLVGNKASGMPVQPTGMPPSVMPAEMTGAVPPGSNNAKLVPEIEGGY